MNNIILVLNHSCLLEKYNMMEYTEVPFWWKLETSDYENYLLVSCSILNNLMMANYFPWWIWLPFIWSFVSSMRLETPKHPWMLYIYVGLRKETKLLNNTLLGPFSLGQQNTPYPNNPYHVIELKAHNKYLLPNILLSLCFGATSNRKQTSDFSKIRNSNRSHK